MFTINNLVKLVKVITLIAISISQLSFVVDAESVKDLTQFSGSSFDQEIGEYDFALVEFYAPWCGHCKEFAPVYEEFAGNLSTDERFKDKRILISKVDATASDDENSLGFRYEIEGFPTILVFKDGMTEQDSVLQYSGERTMKHLLSFIESIVLYPPYTVANSWEDVKDRLNEETTAVVAYFPEKSMEKQVSVFEKAIFGSSHSFILVKTTMPELETKAAGTKSNTNGIVWDKTNGGIYVFRPRRTTLFFPSSDSNLSVEDPLLDQKSVKEFIKMNAFPAFMPWSNEVLIDVVENGFTELLLVFHDPQNITEGRSSSTLDDEEFLWNLVQSGELDGIPIFTLKPSPELDYLYEYFKVDDSKEAAIRIVNVEAPDENPVVYAIEKKVGDFEVQDVLKQFQSYKRGELVALEMPDLEDSDEEEGDLLNQVDYYEEEDYYEEDDYNNEVPEVTEEEEEENIQQVAKETEAHTEL